MLQNRILQINDNGKQDNLFYEREDMYKAFYKETKRIVALNDSQVVVFFMIMA